MAEIQVSIENPFVTKNPRPERRSGLFSRAYRQLTEARLNPGQIVALFTRIHGDYKLFGVLTLNGGGSVSFFPDFYRLDNFDHLTLSRDFIAKQGHLTKVETDGSHTKTVLLKASALAGTDYHHLITFGMNTDDLLMDAPREIPLPPISYTSEEERQKYIRWIEGSGKGHAVLDFPEGEGAYFVQVLVLPKGKSSTGLAVERGAVEQLVDPAISLEGKTISSLKIDIPTPDNSDFSICILTFRVEGGVRGGFGLIMASAEEPRAA
jgi:hypothetical protein